MKMNTLDVVLAQTLSAHVIVNREINHSDLSRYAITSANKTISNKPFTCFSSNYYQLGGHRLPSVVVNMALRNVVAPSINVTEGNAYISIFMNIAQQISDMNIHHSKDVWRLSCIFTQEEYGFTIPFLTWFLKKHL